MPEAYTPELLAGARQLVVRGLVRRPRRERQERRRPGARSNPDAQKQVAQVESLLGIKLDDIYALLAGEHALYAGPGAPSRRGCSCTRPIPSGAQTTLRALTAR